MKKSVKKYIEQVESNELDLDKLNKFLDSINKEELADVRNYMKTKLDLSNNNIQKSINLL